jgi:hypothetical protein
MNRNKSKKMVFTYKNTKMVTFVIFFLFCSCGNKDSNQQQSVTKIYCPLGNFSVAYDAIHGKILSAIESPKTPCEAEEVDKAYFVAIYNEGYVLVQLDERLTKFKPIGFYFHPNFKEWQFAFQNDSLKAKIFISNIATKSYIVKEHIYKGSKCVYFDAKCQLSLKYNGQVYEYEFKKGSHTELFDKFKKTFKLMPKLDRDAFFKD